MVRLAEKAGAEADHPRDRGDDPEVDSGPLEHRSLLDVELEVRAHLVRPPRLVQPREVEPGLGHRLGDTAAPPVLQVAVAAE
ncbi:MAG: hypothetical protein ACREJR_00745, partial [Candidatus Rokuibacteriota bacterium]